jgi:KilA-N domain
MKLITHSWNGSEIAQLSEAAKIANFDVPLGYVNATQMCKACSQQWGHYSSLDSTKAYWEALSLDIVIPISKLVISIKGRGDKIPQGTWVHPEIAVDLAAWVSVEFRIWANRTLVQVFQQESQKPKTKIQVLAEIAQQMAEQEQRLLEYSNRIAAIEAEQERYNYPGGHKFTVMGFANLNGIDVSAKEAANKGRKASLICRTRNIVVERIHDPRFGQVGIYPEEILVEVFKGS